jgi:hypothetical protein
MNQVETYIQKLTQGANIKIKDLDLDPNFSYSIHTAITMGNFDDMHDVTINGVQNESTWVVYI